MSLDEATVKKVAKLARIKLSDAEIKQMAGEMAGILKWVEQLQSVNTEGVPQMFGHSGMNLPLREDKVSDGGIQEDLLANAPAQEFGCFAVPKVVE